MDILKSSNVEPVLFDLFGAVRTGDLMQQLDDRGCYQLEPQEHDQIKDIFAADSCTDEEGKQYIRQAFAKGYLVDPHTATCFKTCQSAQFRDRVNIIYSTAEWTKFASGQMDKAITGSEPDSDQMALKSVAAAAGIESGML